MTGSSSDWIAKYKKKGKKDGGGCFLISSLILLLPILFFSFFLSIFYLSSPLAILVIIILRHYFLSTVSFFPLYLILLFLSIFIHSSLQPHHQHCHVLFLPDLSFLHFSPSLTTSYFSSPSVLPSSSSYSSSFPHYNP